MGGATIISASIFFQLQILDLPSVQGIPPSGSSPFGKAIIQNMSNDPTKRHDLFQLQFFQLQTMDLPSVQGIPPSGSSPFGKAIIQNKSNDPRSPPSCVGLQRSPEDSAQAGSCRAFQQELTPKSESAKEKGANWSGFRYIPVTGYQAAFRGPAH
jgi:hypothetical protein